MPAGEARYVAQLGDGPAALRGVAVLDAGVEERHARIHERGTVARVERAVGCYGLEARADAANGVGPARCTRSRDAGGDHGGGRHGGLAAGGDNAAGVEEGPDAVDGVGAVVESGAKGGGQGGHVLGREGLVVLAQSIFEGVEGVADFGPFGFGGSGCRVKLLVFEGDGGGNARVAVVVEAGR